MKRSVIVDFKQGRSLGAGHWCFLGLLLAAMAFFSVPSCQAQSASKSAVDGLVPKFINAGGIRTRYYEYGKGAPLVLIHGGGGNSPNNANIWSKNIMALSKHFLVIAPDRLGCGMTGGTYAESLNFQDEANWLYNFLKALHLSQVNLVGHSAGGLVVTWFAVDHPDMIKTLTVMSAGLPSPGSDRPNPSKFTVEMHACPTTPLFAAQKCRLSILAYYPKRAFNPAWWKAQLYMKNWRDAHFKVPNASPVSMGKSYPQFESQLHNVWNKLQNGILDHKPVLIMYGAQDPFNWAANAPTDALAGSIARVHLFGAKDPNVQLIVINDAGHFLYRDQPAVFNADLTNFLEYWSNHPTN